MAVTLAQPVFSKKAISIATSATTGSSAAFTIPFADAWTFYLNVTTAGQTSADVVFLTSVDSGTTYVNVPWRFAQVTTATGCFVLNVHSGCGRTSATGTLTTGEGANTAATGGALNLQAIVDPRFMKIGYTITGTAPGADLYVVAYSPGTVPTPVD